MIRLWLLLVGLLYFPVFANPRLAVEQQYQESRNKLTNPGFENGRSSWSSSGLPTIAITTTAANVSDGERALSFDAVAASDALISDSWTMEAGAQSQNCLGKIRYKGGDENLTFKATDGTNTLVSATLSAQTGWVTENLNFICPASGFVRLEVEAGADAAVAYFDDAYIGLASNLFQGSQAQSIGSLSIAGVVSCAWERTGAGADSFANFSADSDCGDPVVTGSAVSAGKLPAINFSSLGAGDYLVTSTFSLQKSGANSGAVMCRLSDGSTSSQPQQYFVDSNSAFVSPMTLRNVFKYTSAQSSPTFHVQCRTADTGNTVGIQNGNTSVGFDISVFKFPTTSELHYTPETKAWKVDANISGGAPSLGNASVTSYTGLTHSSLTLVNNSGYGNISAQIPCAGTEAPSGTTCSSGDESVGVSFDLPRAGDVLACASFSNEVSVTTGRVKVAFQIVETAADAQTILQEGKDRTHFQIEGVGSLINVGQSWRKCGTFSFDSAGQKTLRLFYEQNVETGTISGSTVLADASASDGQRDIHWEVYPITQNFPLPVILKQVATPASGGVRIATAQINNASGTSNCTVITQDGDWIGTPTEAVEGRCVIPVNAGVFSATPHCFLTSRAGSFEGNMRINAASSSSITVDTINDAGSALASLDFNLMCVGAR